MINYFKKQFIQTYEKTIILIAQIGKEYKCFTKGNTTNKNYSNDYSKCDSHTNF